MNALSDKTFILLSTSHDINDDMIYFRYAESLKKTGGRVIVMDVDDGEHPVPDSAVEIDGLSPQKSRFSKFFGNSSKLIKKVREYDPANTVVLLFTLDLVVFAKKLIRRGYPVIQVYVENFPRKILCRRWIPKPFRRAVSRWIASRQEKTGKACFANVFVDSFTMEEQGKGVSNPLLLPNYPIDSKTATVSGKTFQTPVSLVYVGSISPERGLYLMKEMVESLPPELFTLTVYGSCRDEADRETLAELVKTHSNVQYPGALPYDEVLEKVKEFDVGLAFYERSDSYTYIAENTTKLFEYMQAGLPVVTQDFPGLRRIMEEDGAGVCLNTDEPDWCEKLKELLADREALTRMSENGIKAYREKRNWACCEALLLRFLEEH